MYNKGNKRRKKGNLHFNLNASKGNLHFSLNYIFILKVSFQLKKDMNLA